MSALPEYSIAGLFGQNCHLFRDEASRQADCSISQVVSTVHCVLMTKFLQNLPFQVRAPWAQLLAEGNGTWKFREQDCITNGSEPALCIKHLTSTIT